MWSGYNTIETNRAIPTMQNIGLNGRGKELSVMVHDEKETPLYSRMASAATLSTGEVLMTGGSGMDMDDVFLLSGTEMNVCIRREPLLEGRLGHASIEQMLGNEVTVVVAGGWGNRRQALASVELFRVEKNQWENLHSLPSPRVDFTLQVAYFLKIHTINAPQKRFFQEIAGLSTKLSMK
jgi:hypothetical protein